MDLNYLLGRHQLSLMRVATAGCVSSRASHQGLADGYAQRVRALQRTVGGASVIPLSRTRAATPSSSHQEAIVCRAR